MKNFYKHLILFVALSIALSSFTACLDKGNSSTSPADNSAQMNAEVIDDKPDTVKKGDFPNLPAGIMNGEIKTLDGGKFKMSDKKGKVVLMNLWATWCGPCVEEMPELIAMQEKYKDQGFEVIGLNADDEDADKIKSFAAKQNLNYTLGWADQELMNEFVKVTNLGAIPQSILVNREGKMTGVFTGGGNQVVNKMKETVAKTVAQ